MSWGRWPKCAQGGGGSGVGRGDAEPPNPIPASAVFDRNGDVVTDNQNAIMRFNDVVP